MARKAKKNSAKEIESLRYDDKRTNIPTAEQQSHVREHELNPEPVVYRRDPDLDPQLVWRGKDRQDSEDLLVHAVPIYIQEKVHPHVIIDDLKRRSDRAREEREEAEDNFTPDLFADFNGIDSEDEYQFYAHEHEVEGPQRNWANRMILGDSLLVMASLAQKEAMRGKVQCIYIDPPYGIKFNSNWQPSVKNRDVKDGKAESLTREPEMVRAFRDTWKDGIHSYLSYLRDRLASARDLLADTGSIFVQIGDENVHVVRSLMDEVFGPENYVSSIVFKKKSSTSTTEVVNDYLIWFAKERDSLKLRPIYQSRRDPGEGSKMTALLFREGHFLQRSQYRDDEIDQLLSEGAEWGRVDYPVVSQHPSETRSDDYTFRGTAKSCGQNKQWRYSLDEGLSRLEKAYRLFDGKGSALGGVMYWADWNYQSISNIWDDVHSENFPIYVVQTATNVVERCLLMTTDPGDLVLDPTCGSGTTAFVAEQWGRRWLTIDTSRVALALCRRRLMAAKFPPYMLQDTPEGVRKEAELSGRAPSEERIEVAGREGHRPDLHQGFVLERARRITLKSIAYNAEIDDIWEAHQEPLASLLDRLNEVKDEAWEEWEVPRDPADPWPEDVRKAHSAVFKARDNGKDPARALKKLNGLMKRDYTLKDLPEKPQEKWTDETAIKIHREYWEGRRARQEEIDASIARNAETEFLVDKPYEVRNRVRVTGPFTVESLSPHRVLPTEEEADEELYRDLTGEDDPPARTRSLTRTEAEARAAADFITVVLDNLKASGVQNTKKDERLEFTELKPYAGNPIIAAEGRYMEGETEKRVAVVIGPEYGTVGWGVVREAAREARELFDVMVVCGFAFEPSVSDDRIEKLGGLRVLKARMNNDLHMAGALKAAGAGNLFVVFGEPDIKVQATDGGRLQVEILGVDVFDPTTGEVRSSDVNDIACWFVDTDYSAESFFVRHAYFLGGNDPYKKLRNTLKAEIDEEAWDALYSSVSRPFDPPDSGRIAVKVINHYGDEVLKVYEAGKDW